MVRRIIEKTLDRYLRSYIDLSSCQRGFIPLPGTHINSTIINGCLQSSKHEHKDCCIFFLDVTKAYDNIGHTHLKRCLSQTDLPTNLRDLIIDLIEGNTIQIETGLNKSKNITLQKGVAQGSPFSPILFNLVINEILK